MHPRVACQCEYQDACDYTDQGNDTKCHTPPGKTPYGGAPNVGGKQGGCHGTFLGGAGGAWVQ